MILISGPSFPPHPFCYSGHRSYPNKFRHAWLSLLLLFTLAVIKPRYLFAEPVAARFREGAVHGYLALRAPDRKIVASGDLIQVTRGNQVRSRLTFHFKDGSIDDETAVFTQRDTFKLLTDHHIQKGPSFPEPIDVSVNASTCQVTVRYTDKGQKKVETEHLDLPPDLANGLLLNALKNIRPDVRETKVSYLAATPKPRIVKLSIKPEGEDAFSTAGARHKAVRFVVKVELGGVAGVIAPIIGKQPADIKVWIAADEVPAFIKSEGPLFQGGPIWTIEMVSPAWATAP